MPRPVLNRTILEDAVQDVIARAMQSFSYYHWWQLEKSYPALIADTTSITVKNAALESSLMSIRDLDDFFLSNPNARIDDLLASDYGFPAGRNFLKPDERVGINKKLAHLTSLSAQQLAQDPFGRNPRTWNYADLASRTISCLLEFLEHLEKVFFVNQPEQAELIALPKRIIHQTIGNINSISRLDMEFPA